MKVVTPMIFAAVAMVTLGSAAELPPPTLNLVPYDLLLPQPAQVRVGTDMVPVAALENVRVVTAAVPGAPEAVSAEAYALEITAGGVTVTAADPRGERWARVTLRQLAKLTEGGTLPSAAIVDWPAFRWRGYMNDCGRNYLALEGVKAIVDMMSAYKLNVFHWHLSDYHGWRLESKIRPELQRRETFRRQVGRYYTQDEFREIVRYAADRGVTVMPELDVPGHTLAFRKGLGIESMGANGTDRVVSELLAELCSLVDAKSMPFVHLGTDEVRVKAEFCDESWPTAWARTLNRLGRRAVVWAPGKRIDGTCDVVDMVWNDGHVTNSVNQAIDAARMYHASWTPTEVLTRAAFVKPCRWPVAEDRKLGAITCTWHDDNVGDDTLKLFRECPVFPSIVAMSDTFWHGRAADAGECIGLVPAPGTSGFAQAAALERRILAQRDRVLGDFPHPFPFFAQTPLRWLVTDLATGRVLARDLAQSTVYLKSDKIPLAGVASNATGRVAVETWIHAPEAVDCGAWIDLSGANGVYGRMNMPHTPKAGEWNAYGGTVELNGEKLPPPDWRQPGLTNTTPWVCEQDVPWSTDLLERPLVDEMPTLRPLYPIRLRRGWNHVRITTSMEGTLQRQVSFSPLGGTATHPREVPGIRYGSGPCPE